MNEDSVLIIQTSQANMVKNYQFDTIYHEHISFFNKSSISRLFNRCGLEIVHNYLEESIHGGSDVYELKKLPNISILNYSDFSNRSYKFAEEFRLKIEELQKEESVIWLDAGLFGTSCSNAWRDYMRRIIYGKKIFLEKIFEKVEKHRFICTKGNNIIIN